MTDTTISRLQSANPIPETPVIDNEELFARITATPGDPRLRNDRGEQPRGRRPRRRFVAVAVALGAIVLVVAPFAITKLTSDSPGPVKAPVTRHEYHSAQRDLTLPPGYHWPHIKFPSNTVTGVGAGGGHAVLVAQNDWECYWVKAIRTGDGEAQQRAYAMLEHLLHHNMFVAPVNASENWTPPNAPTYPYAVLADDGGYQSIARAYAQAAAGHPQQLIQSCRANRS
jgi:hypothetical protein